MKKHLCLVILLILGVSLSASAQWSTDTQENTLISDFEGEKAVTHIAQTEDGKYFISWYGGADNYNMNLALLDSTGYSLWDEPLVVSDHPQNTWVADYSLAVDNDGNAVISFADIRNGNPDLVIYKVDQNGEHLFGDDGVMVTETDSEEFFPTICVTESNETVVTWQHSDESGSVGLALQRIDTNGALLWEEPVILIDEEFDYNTPVPIATTEDEVIVLYFYQSGPFFSPDRELYAQRFDVNGVEVWENPTVLCGVTGIPGFAFPQAKSDGNGGLITSWQDDRDNNQLGNVAVQHLLEDGSLQFPENGIELVEAGSMGHFSPSTAGIDEAGSIVVYWRTTNSSQGMSGLKSQKIAADGTRVWSDQGVELLELGSHVQLVNGAALHADSSWVSYSINPDGNQAINEVYLFGLDGDGEIILDQAPVATAATSKGDVVMSGIYNGQLVNAWVNDADPSEVRAQAIEVLDTDVSVEDFLEIADKTVVKQLGDRVEVEPEVASLEIYSISGRLLSKTDCLGKKEVLLPSDLPNSIFILLARDRSGRPLQSFQLTW
ncbi:hypothetical protein [Halocola ammonii]